MKIKATKRNYLYTSIFKLSAVFILILSAIGVAGAIALFMFGLSWVFMGAYQNETVSDKHIAWGIVMICLGSYLILMNAFALITNVLSVNRRTARWALLISIVAILGILPMPGGIVMLFTPIEVKDSKESPTSQASPTPGPKKKKPQSQENLVVNKFSTNEEDRELMASQLRTLKLKIDQHTASETEKEKFENLLAEYREKYPKTD